MLLSQTFGYGNLRMAGSQVANSTVILDGNDLRQNVDFEREETALQIFLGYGNFM